MMRLPTLYFSVLFLSIGTYGDIYLHNPRGSNNRLNEQSRERANANRLFDSQNNNRGGYNVGEKSMYYYAGSELSIEWTNQHSCAHPNAYCEVIIQYMCGERIRDGLNTGTIAENAFGDCDLSKGMHENYKYYHTCKQTERNQGLFTADQKLNGNTAKYTRQNPGGTRRGFECPEERDYYPYWRPSPWKDIVIMTNNVSRCAYYKAESQNVKEKYYCQLPQRQTHFNSRTVIPITKEACEQLVVNGERANWIPKSSHELPAPDCIETKWSRDNHLGNGKGGFTNKYMWKLPNIEKENCVIRIRYNISTNDYDSWNTFSEANKPTTGSDYTKINIGKNVGLTEDQAKSRGYVFKNNPQIEILKDNNKLKLQLAINTAQYGRTFQDRTHTFSIRKRPESLKNVRIVNMNVRGKRGNIVQVYPAVEYDFVPNRATVLQGDYVHFQWTGANTNPRNNAGQGAAGTDRSNVALLQSQRYPEGNPNAITPKKVGQFGVNYPAHLDTCMVTSLNFDRRFLMKLALQGLDNAYFDAGPWKTTTTGTFFYFSSRNNAFTNRSQKGKLLVMPSTSSNTSSDSNNSPSKRKADEVELENNHINEVSRDAEWAKLE